LCNIINASRGRNDEKWRSLQDLSSTAYAHRACRKTFTHPTEIQKAKLYVDATEAAAGSSEASSSPKKETLQRKDDSFDFHHACVICALRRRIIKAETMEIRN